MSRIRLDLSRFEESVKVKVGGAGRDSWPPRLLISMWIYAYTRGVSSAREIGKKKEKSDIHVRYLSRGDRDPPSF